MARLSHLQDDAASEGCGGHWMVLCSFIAAAAGLVGLLFGGVLHLFRADAARDPVFFSPNPAHAGDVLQGQTASIQIGVSNGLPDAISIESIDWTCGCTSAQTRTPRLASCETGVIEVALNAHGRSGPFGGQVNVRWRESGGAFHTNSVIVGANAVRIVVVDPPAVNLGQVDMRLAGATGVVTVAKGEARIPWDGLAVEASDGFTASAEETARGQWTVVVLRPRSDVIGAFRGVVGIRPLRGGESVGPAVTVPVFGRWTGDVAAAPPTIYLGLMDAGTITNGLISVMGADGSPAVLRSWTSTVPGFLSVTGATTNAGLLSVHYQANATAASGNCAGDLVLTVGSARDWRIRVPFMAMIKGPPRPPERG